MTYKYEIQNADNVKLTISPVFDTGEVDLKEAHRIVVDSFNFTVNEENTSLSGAGRRTPKGITSGDVTYSFSFTIQGTSRSLLKNLVLSDGRSRWIAFTAVLEDGTVFDMSAGKLTSFPFDGSNSEATEYAVEGIAVKFDIRNVPGIKDEDE